MPQIISTNTGNTGAESELEMMRNISFLTKEYAMGFSEIMSLPYIIFLSYLKQARVSQLESTEEGRNAIKQGEMINQTEPDIQRFRQHTR